MRLPDTTKDALGNLTSNPLRTGLTMLGVIIGVAAVISMISIVEGGQKKLMESIERMGTNLLFVWDRKLSPEEKRQFPGHSKGLTYQDVMSVRKLLPELLIAPMQFLNGQQLKAGTRDATMQITATTPEYEIVRNFHPAEGRFLVQQDVDQWKRVVVLGTAVATQLFDKNSPLGQEMKIGGHRFRVVGVMEPKGSVYRNNWDEDIFIPLPTAYRWFTGDTKVLFMIVHVPNRADMGRVKNKLQSYLIQRHDGVENIRINSQAEFLKAMDRTIWTFRMVLGGVALVALLVGGIGIMNIMLVSVTIYMRLIARLHASRDDVSIM